MTDMVTNLTEAVQLINGTAAQAALQFQNNWLARYPHPMNVIHDQGSEFIGYEFQAMLQQHGINARPITSKNPQGNSVAERLHQSIGNSLRVLQNLQPPQGAADAYQMVDTALASAVYAIRSSFSSAINTTPGGLAFGRDMIMNLPLVMDLQLLQEQRQQLIDQRLVVANRKRFSHDYQIGDEVLKISYRPNKLDPRATGPYNITRVHANGTVTIQRDNNVTERLSLRRVKPYRR